MSEKRRYGTLEMDEETKKRFDKEIRKQPFHGKPGDELKQLLTERRKGLPRPIDVHCHPYTKTGWKSLGQFRPHLEAYLYGKKDITAEQITAESPTDEEWVQAYREMGVVATPVGWDAETTMGLRPPYGPDDSYIGNTNDYMASLRDRFPDVVPTAWGSVDPWKGKKALEEAERAFKKLKLIGFKFQQTAQAFMVNDRQFYPLWDFLQELKAPVQFHTGYTGLGGGAPGGLGVKLRYTMDMLAYDDIAADFPNLKIILLHPAEGRDEDAVLICRHKGNVYRELSGMWPEYIPINVHSTWYEINRRQQDKYMFGSEYNLFPLHGIMYQQYQLDYREGVLEKVLYKNTIRILGEELERSGVNLKEWEGA